MSFTMKCLIRSLIPVLLLAAVSLAEPPVGDGYPSARSSHDHHASDHSISPEYGPPTAGSARNADKDGYEYNAPNTRNSQHTRNQSRSPPAVVRVSFNQRFNSAASRKSDNTARSRNQDHSAPNARNGISQEYGTPSTRSPSQEYGAPSVVSARTLSTEYGMPDTRFTPSEEYGVPVVASRNQKPLPNSRNAHPSRLSSHEDIEPASKSQSQSYNSYRRSGSSPRSNDKSEGYEAPKSNFGARNAPSSTYGAPSTRSTHSSARNSNSRDEDSISQSYGAPEQNHHERAHEDLSVRGLSQEYGAPTSKTNLMTSAVPSSISHPSSRSSPSSSYLPASRTAAPSDQYGAPAQSDTLGLDLARARALEELLSQEPASYDFGYQIEDQESGSDFGHSETREAGKAQGSYFVVRPDGSKQVVDYEADERGFKPRISVEPPPSARSGGYDDNAQDITTGGPY